MYIVSTLARTGPTNQLFNIASNLDGSKYEAKILTLSSEPNDSLSELFKNGDIPISSLNMSRISSLFTAKKKILKEISDFNPDIIQTQGLRADQLLASMNLSTQWITTSRNYPYEDYLSKFGPLLGRIMASSHMRVLKMCSNLISCSRSIHEKLEHHGIKSHVIQNGVREVDDSINEFYFPYEQPVFISVGSLIPRKNMSFLIEVCESYFLKNKGSLIILGDGPQKSDLSSLVKSDKVHLLGQVKNVRQYLENSDFFMSSSLSEGLPNTVLEAASLGLPMILSNIEPHKELIENISSCAHIFVNNDISSAEIAINNIVSATHDRDGISLQCMEHFSAKAMSNNYQKFYTELLK